VDEETSFPNSEIILKRGVVGRHFYCHHNGCRKPPSPFQKLFGGA